MKHIGAGRMSYQAALQKIKQAGAEQWEELYLAREELVEIPAEIGQLTNLKVLDLSFNRITTIPDVIGRLVNLRELFLVSNQITVIPESIGQLINLQELGFGSNRITVIPESISQLSKLVVFDVSCNQIAVIPESIGQITSLKSLDLMDNEMGASHFCNEYNYSSRFAIKSQRMEKLYRGRNCDDPRRTTKSKRLFKRDCKDPIC